MQRKLAAILAADVVGYSRLIAEDESRTLDALRALRRELFEPLVAARKGEVVKRMGDGWFVAFGSAADAVSCAIEIQEKLSVHDRIKLRIGVHLGDIVLEDEDLFGDGVNIAARLQEIAEPGGVVLSGIAYESIIGRLDGQFIDAGEQNLKNVDRPIRTWRWATQGAAAVLPVRRSRLRHELPDKPSVAVLPFTCLGGDETSRQVTQALSGTLSGALASVPQLFVIDAGTTIHYRDNEIEPRVVAEELGVQYLVRGTVQWAGNRMRAAVNLLDAVGGRIVWSHRYDRTVEDIFAVQDDITKAIIAEVAGSLVMADAPAYWASMTGSLDAYLEYLNGISELFYFEPDHNQRAREHAERALALDPNFASAWNLLAWTYYHAGNNGWNGEGPVANMPRAEELAEKAIALAPRYGTPIALLASIANHSCDSTKTIALCRQAIEVAPNETISLGTVGRILRLNGEVEAGLDALTRAVRLSPKFPIWIGQGYVMTLYFAGRIDEAAEFFDRLLTRELRLTEEVYCVAFRAALATLRQETEIKRDMLKRFFDLVPDGTTDSVKVVAPVPHKDRRRMVKLLQTGGIPLGINDAEQFV